MSDVQITDHEDGSATLSSFAGDVHVKTIDCDGCGKRIPIGDRDEVLLKRPSTGDEVPVLWVCAECAPEVGATKAVDE